MININKLTKKNNKNELIINELDLILPNNGLIFLTGGINSGSHEILNILTGLTTDYEGQVTVVGKDISQLNEKDFDSFRNTYLGILTQYFNLIEDTSIHKNMELAVSLQEKKMAKGELRKLMDAVGLNHLTEKAIVGNLTNLEKQKVAIIRSLIRNPKIILGYEPAGHLDMIGTKITYDLFRRMSRNKLIIIATHDVEMARKYGDRVIDIKAGKVVSDTNTAEVTQVAENFGLIESKLPLKEVFTSAIENIFSSLAGLIITFTAIFFFLVSTGLYFGFNNKTLQNEHEKVLLRNEEFDVKLTSTNIFSEDEIVTINNESNFEWLKEYEITNNYPQPYLFFPKGKDNLVSYYTSKIDVVFTNYENKNGELKGRVPEEIDEMIISQYVADNIIKNGINTNEGIYTPKNYEEIINDTKNVEITNLTSLKIVGIVMDKNLEKYNDMLSDVGGSNDELTYKINNIYNRLYVLPEFINSYFKENSESFKTTTISGDKEVIVNKFGYLTKPIQAYDGITINPIEDINDEDIILSFDLILEMFDNNFEEEFLSAKELTEEQYVEAAVKFIIEKDLIGKNINSSVLVNKLGIKNTSRPFRIAGVIFDEESTTYYSKNNTYKFIAQDTYIKSLFLNVTTKDELKKVFSNKLAGYSIKTVYTKDLNKFIPIFGMIVDFTKYAAIASGILSIVFLITMFNYGLNRFKHKLSIFRMLGCSKKVTTIIFASQGIIISFIAFIASAFALIQFNEWHQFKIRAIFKSPIVFYEFGPIQFGIMILALIVIMVLSISIIANKAKRLKLIDIVEIN